MGWLFGKKKKVPRAPLPQGDLMDEKALRFPTASSSERVIEPEKVKEAAGLEKPLAFPEEISAAPASRTPPVPKMEPEPTREVPQMPALEQPLRPQNTDELYVKVEVYQRVLGERESLKKELAELSEINKELESSEFNEENNFNRLKRSMKILHDSLLQIDKTIFKQ